MKTIAILFGNFLYAACGSVRAQTVGEDPDVDINLDGDVVPLVAGYPAPGGTAEVVEILRMVPVLVPAYPPLNPFHIGDSIGEGAAA